MRSNMTSPKWENELLAMDFRDSGEWFFPRAAERLETAMCRRLLSQRKNKSPSFRPRARQNFLGKREKIPLISLKNRNNNKSTDFFI